MLREQKDFSYYTYEVGRYIKSDLFDHDDFKPYKHETKKLVWNVFNEDGGKIIPINVFEYNWVFLRDGLLYAKKHYSDNFEQFAEHIRGWLQHEYWSRSEYETIITSWPPYIEEEELDRLNKAKEENIAKGYKFYRESVDLTIGYKMDIYTQIMMNWDRFIEYVWNNKRLITKKKLGLE